MNFKVVCLVKELKMEKNSLAGTVRHFYKGVSDPILVKFPVYLRKPYCPLAAITYIVSIAGVPSEEKWLGINQATK